MKVFGGIGQSQVPEPSFQKLATNQRGESYPWKSGRDLLPVDPGEERSPGNGGGERAWSGNRRGFLDLLSPPLLLLPHHHLRSSGNKGFGLVRVAPQRAQPSANQGLLSKAGPFETNNNFHHVTPQELIASPVCNVFKAGEANSSLGWLTSFPGCMLVILERLQH